MKHTILFGIFAALASTCAAQDVAPIDTISDFNYVWQPHDEYDLFFNKRMRCRVGSFTVGVPHVGLFNGNELDLGFTRCVWEDWSKSVYYVKRENKSELGEMIPSTETEVVELPFIKIFEGNEKKYYKIDIQHVEPLLLYRIIISNNY